MHFISIINMGPRTKIACIVIAGSGVMVLAQNNIINEQITMVLLLAMTLLMRFAFMQ